MIIFSRDLEILGLRSGLEDKTNQYARIIKEKSSTILKMEIQLKEFKNMSSSCNSELKKCLESNLAFNRDNKDLELEIIYNQEELERKVNRKYRNNISIKNEKIKKMRKNFQKF